MRNGYKNGEEVFYDRFGNELFSKRYINGKEISGG